MLNKIKQNIIGEHLTNLESQHDKTRLTLLFNIAFFILSIGIIATITSLILGTYPILIPSIGNVILALITLVLIKYVNFQFSAIFYFFMLFLLLFGNLIFNKGTMHVGGPFWVMLLNILVFYILGRVWGAIYITLSILAFGYFVAFVFPITIELVQDLPKETYYSALYETLFALAFLGYILSTILNASKESDQMLKISNQSLKKQNETILENYDEKIVLLKEIHHRVKNNLQVIVSLMRLQMHTLTNPEALSSFQETINRVVTMSMIHEQIYQTESLSQVNLENYFHDLSQDLISTFQTDFEVDLDYSFKVDNIGLKTIVPLALIFNELFSNSLKHAFPHSTHPKISIIITQIKEGEFRFSYTDNGMWKKPAHDSTFGMELIDSLTSQLDGELKFETHPQTKYEFTFSKLDL